MITTIMVDHRLSRENTQGEGDEHDIEMDDFLPDFRNRQLLYMLGHV